MEIKQIDKFNQRDQSNNMYKIMYITTLLLYIVYWIYSLCNVKEAFYNDGYKSS